MASLSDDESEISGVGGGGDDDAEVSDNRFGASDRQIPRRYSPLPRNAAAEAHGSTFRVAANVHGRARHAMRTCSLQVRQTVHLLGPPAAHA
ncbi:hypothetical protein TSMEX_002212, partial [Taenia solium]